MLFHVTFLGEGVGIHTVCYIPFPRSLRQCNYDRLLLGFKDPLTETRVTVVLSEPCVSVGTDAWLHHAGEQDPPVLADTLWSVELQNILVPHWTGLTVLE